jgi:NAD(P)H-dependent FMN reductase
MKLRVVLFYGSVRQSRQGIKAARFVAAQCRVRGHDLFLIDPAEQRLPLLDRMYKEYAPGEAPATLETLASHVRVADAYVIVSGEYNHTVPPALTNLLDHFLEEYFWKPSGIVCYSAGGFGGVRASIALRPMLAELGMSSIPSVLPIPRVQEAFDDDGTPKDPAWTQRADRFLAELEWYAEAMRAARLRDGKAHHPDRSFCEALAAGGPARA